MNERSTTDEPRLDPIGASQDASSELVAESEPSGFGPRIDDDDVTLRQREAQLRAYAHLLDSAVRLPGGFRIGLDGLVGLVPGIGDLVGAGLSGYLVVAAARLGIPRAVVARMIANVAIETAVGIVPVVGDVFDFVFKANERNARLLHRELERRDAERAARTDEIA